MSYPMPAIGGISFAFQSQVVHFFIVDVGNGLGWELVCTDTSGNAIYFYGPKADTDMIAEINAAGGILAWLKSKFTAINAALVAHFIPAPPPVGAITLDSINLTISASCQFTAGLNTVILSAK